MTEIAVKNKVYKVRKTGRVLTEAGFTCGCAVELEPAPHVAKRCADHLKIPIGEYTRVL